MADRRPFDYTELGLIWMGLQALKPTMSGVNGKAKVSELMEKVSVEMEREQAIEASARRSKKA